MKSIKILLRLIQINYILAKNGLDNLVVSIPIFAPLKFIVYFNPWNWFRKKPLTRGEALRKSLEELGPIFIKFGQALSTRPDILPLDIAKELNKLQDNVPPFPSDIALGIIEASFGQSAYQMFAQFDSVALASASIAQVHVASLHSGEEVVVKILRPGMLKIIKQDLSIMHTIARIVDRYWSESKRLKPKEIVQEFERDLINELNLMREAANAAQLRRNFTDSPLLYIPEIYWDYCRENIMVMERIYGIPITDFEELRKRNIDFKKLAERGVEIFFTQVFRDCFFHADMHPGNIFVSPFHPNDPQYVCVDFGIIGTLNEEDKRYLAENLYAFFTRDYRRVAELHVESGWVARDTRITEFESAIRTVCEPIFERPLKDISFSKIVLGLFQTARRYNMEVQPQLVLLQKTLLAVEGLGRQLYPELDLWTTAKPFLEDWLRKQIGPKAFISELKKNIPFFTEQLPHMPRLFYDVLQLTKDQKMQTAELKKLQQTEKSKSGHSKAVISGAAIALLGVSLISYFQLIDINQLPLIALASAGGIGIIALFYPEKRS